MFNAEVRGFSTTSAKSLHRDPLLEDSRWGVCWRMGFPVCCFPPVLFPPCGVWLGLCVGRVDPALAFIRWHLGMISPRASARQTRAGRRLAAAGAPQLHSPAPPQQTRRPADNPSPDISGYMCGARRVVRGLLLTTGIQLDTYGYSGIQWICCKMADRYR